jgi:hypothetical protein
MGEIHHAHDAENQRQPDAEQGVGSAEHDGIEQMLEELVHVPLTGLDAADACDSAAWT